MVNEVFRERGRGQPIKDLSGTIKGNLRVLTIIGKTQTKIPMYEYLCKCDCGKLTRKNRQQINRNWRLHCGCMGQAKGWRKNK